MDYIANADIDTSPESKDLPAELGSLVEDIDRISESYGTSPDKILEAVCELIDERDVSETVLAMAVQETGIFVD